MTNTNDLQIGAASLRIRDDLNDYDQTFVPTHDSKYELDESFLEALGVCAETDLPAFLVGPTGCGKSTGVELLAAILNQPVRRINFHADVRSSAILGEKVIEPCPETGGDRIVWKDGILPDAARRGHWLICDEWDAVPAGIGMVLQAVLEGGHPLVLSDNHGEKVDIHPDFRIFATGNTLGRGDESGLYTGTNMLNEATLDRFVVISCDYPSPKVETRVLVNKTGIDGATAAMMVEVAGLVRKALDENLCYCSFSTRRLLVWAGLAQKFGGASNTANVVKGYRFAVSNKLSPEDAEYINGIVQRVMGLTV